MASVPIAAFILVLYAVGALLLTLYTVGELHLLYYYLSRRRRTAHVTPPEPLANHELPRVTVQLPMYNEMYVAERVIDACANFDYPRDLLEIQVCDDSTDASLDLVRRRVDVDLSRKARHIRPSNNSQVTESSA